MKFKNWPNVEAISKSAKECAEKVKESGVREIHLYPSYENEYLLVNVASRAFLEVLCEPLKRRREDFQTTREYHLWLREEVVGKGYEIVERI